MTFFEYGVFAMLALALGKLDAAAGRHKWAGAYNACALGFWVCSIAEIVRKCR